MPLFLQTAVNPGTAYWGPAPAGGLVYWSEDGSGNLYPDTDLSQDLGLETNRVQRFWGQDMVLKSSDGTVYTAGSRSGIVLGNFGYPAPSPTSTISRTGEGAIAGGLLSGANLGNLQTGYIASLGAGSIALGSVYKDPTQPFPIGSGTSIYTNVAGGLAMGRVTAGQVTSGTVRALNAQGESCWALGDVDSGTVLFGNSVVRATAGGAFASGKVGPTGGGHIANGLVEATGLGARAHGHTTAAGGTIRASGPGSLSLGYANGGTSDATGAGAIALGATSSSGYMAASGDGAFILGNASSVIQAVGDGSFFLGNRAGSGNTTLNMPGSFAMGYFAAGNVTTSAGSFAEGSGFIGHLGGIGAGNVSIQGRGCLVLGISQGGTHSVHPNAVGSLVGGDSRSGGILRAGDAGIGSIAWGFTTGGIVEAVGSGTFALGNTSGGGAITANGDAGMAMGRGEGGYIRTLSGGSGGLAMGHAESGGVIETAGVSGGMAGGFSYGADSIIRVAGPGGFAFGTVFAGGRVAAAGTTGGALALGAATGTNSQIYAVGTGSWAGGRALNGYSVTTAFGSEGALAFGLATASDITADGDNCFQFGQGTNDTNDSLQVGQSGSGGLHFHAGGAPGVPVNGDMWVAGGNVYVHSGGVTQNLTNVP